MREKPLGLGERAVPAAVNGPHARRREGVAREAIEVGLPTAAGIAARTSVPRPAAARRTGRGRPRRPRRRPGRSPDPAKPRSRPDPGERPRRPRAGRRRATRANRRGRRRRALQLGRKERRAGSRPSGRRTRRPARVVTAPSAGASGSRSRSRTRAPWTCSSQLGSAGKASCARRRPRLAATALASSPTCVARFIAP